MHPIDQYYHHYSLYWNSSIYTMPFILKRLINYFQRIIVLNTAFCSNIISKFEIMKLSLGDQQNILEIKRDIKQ